MQEIDSTVEIVAGGLSFPEGPVWMLDGSVIVVEVAGGRLSRIHPGGTVSVVSECGGGPGGAAIGPDGYLYVCNNGGMKSFEVDGQLITKGDAPDDYAGGWIDRIDPVTGAVERLYEEVDGIPLAGPNDIVFDEHGGFWFTDLGKPVGRAILRGGLFYASPDGSSVTRVVDGPRYNGVGLSPDGTRLSVAVTHEWLVVEFVVTGPGRLDLSQYPLGRPVGQLGIRQLPDSLAITARGAVCVAATFVDPGIITFSEDQEPTHLAVPDKITTNICFGGPDMQDAWITMGATGQLAKVRWNEPGLRLPFYA